MSFAHFGLSKPLLDTLTNQNYKTPYPIQEQAIPDILKGKDLLGIAKTGSGKTASYVLPILTNMQDNTEIKDRNVNVLVMVPTRELAVQVKDVFQLFGNALPEEIKISAVFGGVSINPQMKSLHGINILIATPGRLLELVDSNAVNLSKIDTLVLDEADKMLNLGFKEEMNRIFSLLPKRRQNLLFSATLTKDVENINQILLHEPCIVNIKSEEDNIDLINQSAYKVLEENKGPLLRYLINSKKMQQVLVFTSSVKQADIVANKLCKNNFAAAVIHSKKSQGARTEALRRFKCGQLKVLVATDLLSRGIDIEFLPFVINYELPRSPKDYIHRVGRTGRAESSGEAISILTEDDLHHFKVIQKKMGKRVAIIDAKIGNKVFLIIWEIAQFQRMNGIIMRL